MTVKVSGLDAAERRIDAVVEGVRDLTPVWRDIADDAARRNASWLASSPWPALSPDYAARKARRYPGQPVEVRTGRLRASLIDVGQLVQSMTPSELKLGTNVPYARAQRRRLLPTASPEQAWRDRIARHVAGAPK